MGVASTHLDKLWDVICFDDYMVLLTYLLPNSQHF